MLRGFPKAFDSVWHDGLFHKLETMGINGNFLDLIKSIYKYTKCAVKINGKRTNFFNYERGVLQGNPLSPILFNLYINEIIEVLKPTQDITLDGDNYFNILMYADDLIILSTKKEVLQQNLNLLQAYCEKWKLSVNIKKTKCMTFTRGTQKETFKFTISGRPLENVKEYKYLGITVNAKNCSFTPSLEKLSTKATNALFALKSKLPLKLISVATALRLFDSCISPILLYASEVWFPYIYNEPKKWDETPIEKVHTQYLKRMLGVNYSTTNLMIRRECGRNPLSVEILKRNTSYIQYLMRKEDAIARQALKYELAQPLESSSITDQLTKLIPKAEVYLTKHILQSSKEKRNRAINCVENVEWKLRMNDSPKTMAYAEFKLTWGIEKYLLNIPNRKLRVIYSKFRLSDHNLMIEQGRRVRPRIPRWKRGCSICCNKVESEMHFLIECPSHETERKNLFKFVNNKYPHFDRLDAPGKFVFLLSQDDTELTIELIKHINRWSSSPRRSYF